MAIVYIPAILAEHYQALCRIPAHGFADSFDKLVDALTKKGAEAIAWGDVVRNVQVDPNEFARFCGTTGTHPDLDGLCDFAAEKSSGKNY